MVNVKVQQLNAQSATLSCLDEGDIALTANGKVMINGELHINGQSLYEVFAEVLDLIDDPNQLALWFISPDAGKRNFAKIIAEKLKKNEQKANTNSD